jgi:hypothetical protein
MACLAAKLHQISSDSGGSSPSGDYRMGFAVAGVIDAAMIQVLTSVLSDGVTLDDVVIALHFVAGMDIGEGLGALAVQ